MYSRDVNGALEQFCNVAERQLQNHENVTLACALVKDKQFVRSKILNGWIESNGELIASANHPT